MSAAEALDLAAASGIQIELDVDSLTLQAPGEPSAELLAKLKAHIAKIVELLRAIAVEEQNRARVDAEFERQLALLKANNASVYANPIPWKSK